MGKKDKKKKKDDDDDDDPAYPHTAPVDRSFAYQREDMCGGAAISVGGGLVQFNPKINHCWGRE